jgi:hypothetical protein
MRIFSLIDARFLCNPLPGLDLSRSGKVCDLRLPTDCDPVGRSIRATLPFWHLSQHPQLRQNDCVTQSGFTG